MCSFFFLVFVQFRRAVCVRKDPLRGRWGKVEGVGDVCSVRVKRREISDATLVSRMPPFVLSFVAENGAISSRSSAADSFSVVCFFSQP